MVTTLYASSWHDAATHLRRTYPGCVMVRTDDGYDVLMPRNKLRQMTMCIHYIVLLPVSAHRTVPPVGM